MNNRGTFCYAKRIRIENARRETDDNPVGRGLCSRRANIKRRLSPPRRKATGSCWNYVCKTVFICKRREQDGALRPLNEARRFGCKSRLVSPLVRRKANISSAVRRISDRRTAIYRAARAAYRIDEVNIKIGRDRFSPDFSFSLFRLCGKIRSAPGRRCTAGPRPDRTARRGRRPRRRRSGGGCAPQRSPRPRPGAR